MLKRLYHCLYTRGVHITHRELKQELKNFNLVPIIEINADEDEEFCEKYNIKNIPVLLLCDNNDNVLYRQVGFISKEDLTRKIIEINENI